jgi:choline kinase
VKGIIVAAGLGQLSFPLTHSRTRLLASNADRPLLDCTIEAFARAGFEEVGVVLGHNGDILRRYLEGSARYGIAVYCLHNPMHWRGNATALYAAQPFVHGEPFVVAVADPAVSAHALLSLLRDGPTSHVVGVRRPKRAQGSHGDVSKVWLDRDSRVHDIGQRLQRWNALAAGVFLFQPQVFDGLGALLQASADPCSVISVVQGLLSKGHEVRSCDVSGDVRRQLPPQDCLCYAGSILSIGLGSLGVRQEDYLA